MKALLVLLVIALAKGDKLNPLYLPPIGANYSGGSSGDIEVPFEVPEERYFTSKDGSPIRIISGFEPNVNFSGIGSSTFAPAAVPSTTSNFDSYSTTPFPDKQSYDKVSQGLLNQPINNLGYRPDQYSDYKGDIIPSITNVQNQFDNIDSTRGIPSYSTTKPIQEFINYKNASKPSVYEQAVFPENLNYGTYPQRVERPQAEADRNSVILNYENIITPEGFLYSYDTSNGIHADESGTATDGVKASGSYSYVGDDGKLYNVTYSADENGFRPQGDHLPTSPPIPDAILKVIEQAAKDKINGIYDDGSYDENKYGHKKYQTPQDNRDFYKLYENGNKKPGIGSQMFRDKNYFIKSTTPPFYTTDGDIIYDSNKKPSLSDKGDVYDYEKQKTLNFIPSPSKTSSQGLNELKKAFDRDSYQDHDSKKPGFSNIQITESEQGYKYITPTTKFESSKVGTGVPERVPYTYGENKGIPTYEYKESFIPDSNVYQKPYQAGQVNDTNFDSVKTKDKYYGGGKEYKAPYIITDEGIKYISRPSKENIFTETENGYTYPKADFQFGQRIPSQPSTSTAFNLPYPSTTSTPFRLPQRISTEAPQEDYEVTSGVPQFPERIKQIDTYTGQPIDVYGPSSTGRMEQIGTYTDRPKDVYVPPSDERIKQVGKYTGRPKDYYGPSSNDRPKDFYSPTSTERIKQIDTYTGQPIDVYGPLSTERIKQIGTYTDQPKDFYSPTSTERIKQIDTYTGRPKDFYGPSSTERMEQIGTYTGRPKDFYGPSSTERIKQIGTYTDQPKDFYSPTSTERIKQIGTYTGQPKDYYGPSSTDRLKDFYIPTSTEGIKQFGTYTDRPEDFYGPSSTERIKQIGTYTDRPDFYGPSTDRIKGENFTGPKQPQRYDPETGYLY